MSSASFLRFSPLLALSVWACQSDPPPPRAEALEAGAEDAGSAVTGLVSAPDRSSGDLRSPDAALSTSADGGVETSGPIGQPVIGFIDADSVTLVEAEAAVPLMPGCAKQEAREFRLAKTLPSQALPLSVTPDGGTWAYALPAARDSDAALDGEFDAGADASPPMNPPAFEITVESANEVRTLLLPNEQDPTLGAALDPDGVRLVTTRADTKGFVLWELTANGETFEPAAAQPFVRLNALAAQGGIRFAHPAFSTSGLRLYVREVHPGTAAVQLVLRDGQWETESRLTEDALLAQDFTVTAASADDLTVFGWSTTEGRSVAWWRPRADEPFESSLMLDAAPLFAVSGDCRDWWTLE